MDLVLFSLYVALMGALSFLIAEETLLYIQAKRSKLYNFPNIPIDIESILFLVVALVLVAITFYYTVFLYPIPTPLDACTTNTTANNICNYLMSIM